MKDRIIDILRIHKEERLVALLMFIYSVVLNAMCVCAYYSKFCVLTDDYHKLFVRTFRISGFDPLTYEVLSDWSTAYNVYRHPLLAFFMWPLSQINSALMWLTGKNWATIITAVVLVFCSFYSGVFLWRILRNVVSLSKQQAGILTAFYFSLAFVMLSSMVPDHFVMSQFCLLLTIWLAGEKLRRGSALNMWQTIGLFVLTAGVSLNNGLKIFLAAFVTRRSRFFRPGYLLLAIALPAALMWGFACWEYKTFVWPKEMARAEVRARNDREAKRKLTVEVVDSLKKNKLITLDADKATKVDSAKVDAEVKRIRNERAKAKYRADHKKIWNRNAGKPIAKDGFMKWTDTSTSRIDVAVENLFGEAVQMHRDNLLGDVLKNREVIVRYSAPWSYVNYTVEAMIVALFLFGIWCGRRRLFLWTALSFFLMDMTLHMGLGFGINEIYIMSVHYLFVVPIAMAYAMKNNPSYARVMNIVVSALALWCVIWNLAMIVQYLFVL